MPSSVLREAKSFIVQAPVACSVLFQTEVYNLNVGITNDDPMNCHYDKYCFNKGLFPLHVMQSLAYPHLSHYSVYFIALSLMNSDDILPTDTVSKQS